MFTRKKVLFLIVLALLVGCADGAELITPGIDQMMQNPVILWVMASLMFALAAIIGICIRREQEHQWYMDDLLEELKGMGSGLHG